MDFFQRDQLAGLAVTTFEHLKLLEGLEVHEVPQHTHGSIGAFTQLLQLLEGAGVLSAFHSRSVLTATQAAHADRRVSAVGNCKGAGVCGLEAAWGRATGVLGIPEDGTGSGESTGDFKLRRRGMRAREGGLLGIWVGRFDGWGRVCRWELSSSLENGSGCEGRRSAGEREGDGKIKWRGGMGGRTCRRGCRWDVRMDG